MWQTEGLIKMKRIGEKWFKRASEWWGVSNYISGLKLVSKCDLNEVFLNVSGKKHKAFSRDFSGKNNY